MSALKMGERGFIDASISGNGKLTSALNGFLFSSTASLEFGIDSGRRRSSPSKNPRLMAW